MSFRPISCFSQILILLSVFAGVLAYIAFPLYFEPPPKPEDTPWPTGLPLITGSDWGLIEMTDPSSTVPMKGIRRVTIHHDGMPPLPMVTPTQIERRIVAIREAHSQKFADISYHYIVDPLGRVWEGRPVEYQGAHVRGQNEHNVGILFLGNTFDDVPTENAVAALCEFVRYLRQRYQIDKDQIFTHLELAATGCPGDKLQKEIVQARKAGLFDLPEPKKLSWEDLWNSAKDFALKVKKGIQSLIPSDPS